MRAFLALPTTTCGTRSQPRARTGRRGVRPVMPHAVSRFTTPPRAAARRGRAGLKAGSGRRPACLLERTLVYVLRAWLDEETSRSPSDGWCAALTDPAIAAALNHIHRHTAHPWTVQELAHRVGMSRTVFARRFTHLVGQARWRM
ncbi:AraC family transcriptional regulator [Streptomyces sp. HUAS ZL42]|uniref:AraC family transcriptional regulator n=1 Tax=Streptomyces sp. HUAS ZL42 TaxID=3231715 RepID=UPI00345EB427